MQKRFKTKIPGQFFVAYFPPADHTENQLLVFLFCFFKEVPAGKTVRIDVSVIIFPVSQWLFS